MNSREVPPSIMYVDSVQGLPAKPISGSVLPSAERIVRTASIT